jgi:protein expanded
VPGMRITHPLQAKLSHVTLTTVPSTQSAQSSIDINLLREKSKNLDLPLISALCNDKNLLKQTKAFVMPRHPRSSLNQGTSSSKVKYPVSGLSTTQKPRKTAVSHRHPNDKLPPLPVQTQAEGNNYVMDPTPIKVNSKSFNSQPTS